eukprot:Awhi_evm1s400
MLLIINQILKVTLAVGIVPGNGSPWVNETRTCVQPSVEVADDCEGSNKQEAGTCNYGECPIDGAWSSWSDGPSCSVSCGPGTTSRVRTCSNPEPQNGEQKYPGEATEDPKPCSVSCGYGKVLQTRTCIQSSAKGSDDCVGSDKQEVGTCNYGECPIDGAWSSWADGPSSSVSCGSGI